MTNEQNNRLTMLRSVRNVVNQNEEAANKIGKFIASYLVLKPKIDEIESIGKQQEAGKTGFATGKNRLKKELALMASKQAYKLTILARQSNNDKMMGEINFNQSDLTGASDSGLMKRARLIYDSLSANLAALEDQGVTAETQKSLLEKIEAFNNSLSTPRSGIAERKNATEKLIKLFEEADSALEIMDLAAASAKDELPDFYSQYRTARRIVDMGLRKITLKAIAIDSYTKEPVRNVLFTFRHNGNLTSTDGNGEIKKKTAKGGKFNLGTLLAGSYHVTISKPGYAEKTTEIIVNEGEKSELKVELVKSA